MEPNSSVRTGTAGDVVQCAGRLPTLDDKLVAAAKRGEAQAFERLLSRHERRIFWVAQNITGNHEDAEEAVQDAFVIAFSRLHAFRGDSRFSTWLTRIAINEALRMRRKHRRTEVVPLEGNGESSGETLPRVIADCGKNPEQRYAQTELRAILQKSIAALRENERIVFYLRDVEAISIDETAEILKLSKPAVKSRLWRARLALRERLNKYFRLPATQNREFAQAAGD